MARRRALSFCVLAPLAWAAVLFPAAASAGSTHSSRQSAWLVVDRDVLREMNQIRVAHHLTPLSLSPNLSAAALQHSREMLADGYFAHNSANGTPFWQRIRSFYPEPRKGYWSVAENLYWTPGRATAAGGLKSWMTSPAHRQNILDPKWREVGIATVGNPGVTIITADFGVRS
jgi:uncharacterized protein YkwD